MNCLHLAAILMDLIGLTFDLITNYNYLLIIINKSFFNCCAQQQFSLLPMCRHLSHTSVGISLIPQLILQLFFFCFVQLMSCLITNNHFILIICCIKNSMSIFYFSLIILIIIIAIIHF
jgi:hypothetical protein